MASHSLKQSRKQENEAAEKFGGRVTPGSGNQWARKNDVRTPDLSMEFKYTDKKSYSLKVEELIAAERHALLDGRTMVFGISFSGRKYVVLSEDDFETMYQEQSP